MLKGGSGVAAGVRSVDGEASEVVRGRFVLTGDDSAVVDGDIILVK